MIIFLFLIIILLSYSLMGGAEKFNCDIKFKPHYSRLLPKNQEKYEHREYYTKISLKLGQRKLLVSELEFLDKFIKKETTVVYAGAAAGYHLTAFGLFFPDNEFNLYDMNQFSPDLKHFKNIKIHQKYFTEEECKKYIGDVLFMSDIRTGSEEQNIAYDMTLQKNWCDVLKPRMALLKFRLPWSAGKTTYYKGDIYLQVRHGATSTESRLWTDCKKLQEYDNNEYNDSIFYFQKNCRNAFHDFELPKITGIDHCYDCWAETQVFAKFAKKRKLTTEDVFKIVGDASRSALNVPPHGLDPNNKNICQKILKYVDITLKFTLEREDKRSAIQADKMTYVAANIATKVSINWQFIKRNPPFDLLITRKYKIDKKYVPHYSRKLPDKELELAYPEPWDVVWTQHSARNVLLNMSELIIKHKPRNVIMHLYYYLEFIFHLFRLFPDVKFYVFFPTGKRSFESIDNLTFMSKMLTNEEMKILPKGALFFSELYFGNDDVQTAIDLNIYWCQKLQPSFAQIAFPLFKKTKEFTFFDGKLITSPYINKFVNFFRLETDCKNMKKYDADSLRRRMFYFDICCRNSFHEHNLPTEVHDCNGIKNLCGNGIDHCYNCWREIRMWRKYGIKDVYEKMTSIHDPDKKKDESYIVFFDKPHGFFPEERNTNQRLHQLVAFSLNYYLINASMYKEISELYKIHGVNLNADSQIFFDAILKK